MGKSKGGRNSWDYEGEGRAFSAMDRRDARKQKGKKRDPEADATQNTVYVPDYRR